MEIPKENLESKNVNDPTVPQQKISVLTIILGVIGSFLTTALLIGLYVWFESYAESLNSNDTTEILLVLAVLFGVLILPGIIVAAIVLPKLRKK